MAARSLPTPGSALLRVGGAAFLLTALTAFAVPGPCAFNPHPELDCPESGRCEGGLFCSPSGFCQGADIACDGSDTPIACDGRCVDESNFLTDSRNCGRCGFECNDGFICRGGSCTVGPDLCRTIEGSVRICSDDELEALDDVCVVEGELAIGGPADCNDNPSRVTAVNLPALVRVGKLQIVRNFRLTEVVLPGLEEIGELELAQNYLQRIELPVLRAISDSYISFIINDSGPAVLIFPALTRTGTLSIHGGDVLETIAAPLLAEATRLSLSGDALELIELPTLVTAEQLEVSDTVVLERVALAELRSLSRSLTISRNESLTSIFFPQLGTVADVTIAGNPRLESCVGDAVKDVGDCP